MQFPSFAQIPSDNEEELLASKQILLYDWPLLQRGELLHAVSADLPWICRGFVVVYTASRKERLVRYLYSAIFLLFSSCLSLKLSLQLPQREGEAGTLELEYHLSEALQNISNYPAPRDNIAPMPLPLWEWDFRAIAAQSPGIELLHYSFTQAREGSIIRTKLSFANEDDLRLLLGPELHWQGQQFRWQLSATRVEAPDASYPQLDAALSAEEQQKLEQFFLGQTLEIKVNSAAGQEIQRLAIADFLRGKRDINLELGQ